MVILGHTAANDELLGNPPVPALIVSLWLCRLIEYYIPELVGIFGRDIISGRERT